MSGQDCYDRELKKGDRVRSTKAYGEYSDGIVVSVKKNGVVEVKNTRTKIRTRAASFLWEKVVA